MTGGRIFYLLPKARRPSGGVKMMVRHVEMLCAAGYDAWLVSARDDDPLASWLPHTAPLLLAGVGRPWVVGPADCLVLPETGLELAGAPGAPRRARRLLFCQNHHYCPPELADWRGLGLSGAFSVSPVISRVLVERFGFPLAPVVPCLVDPLFHRGDDGRRPAIAYMPRKRAEQAGWLRRTLAQVHPDLAAVPWIEIDGQGLADTAALLGRATVFLALGECEGFGLPPLEAMAAGCLVAGFHGGGGLAYARPDNGLWVEDDDPAGGLDQLARAVRGTMAPTPAPWVAAMIAAGRATAAGYTPEHTRRALLELWGMAPGLARIGD